jgi:molybdate transport system substrate-binding protein
MLWKCAAIAVLFFSSAFIFPSYCTAAQKSGEILVSAAISLKNAFEEIGLIYEKQTGILARFNLGASGLLQKQIETGAPVDVFASAGEKQMDELQSKGLIVSETRGNFASNALVLVVPARSKVSLHSFADLARPEVVRVAIGSTKTVPAGQYAQEALKNLSLWDKLQPRLIFAENVRQVLDYVTRGEADAGILYASDMAGVHGEAIVAAFAPKGSHSPIQYPIAVVKQTEKLSDSRRFIDLVISRTGQTILKKFGFAGSQ